MSLLLLLGGSGSVYGSFTVNAAIKRTQTGSLTLNAEIGAKHFAVDAVIKRSQPGSFTLDAVIKRSQSSSILLDAVINRTQPRSFTADAVTLQTFNNWQEIVERGGRPRSWYRFTESTGALVDSGVDAQNASVSQGTPVYGVAPGVFEPAVQLDGSNAFATAAYALTLTSSVITIEAWVWPGTAAYSGSTRQTIWGGNDVAGVPELELGANGGTNRISAIINGTFVAVTNDNAFVPRTWNHIVYTRTGNGASTHAFYVNGVSQGISLNNANNYTSTSAAKRIGARTASTQRFIGLLDEVLIYDRALSAAEVSIHYAAISTRFTLGAWIATRFTIDAEIGSPSFTLNAVIKRTQTSSFTVNAEIRPALTRIFRDDFNRVTTPHEFLSRWAWDIYDSFSGDIEQVKAYTDGSNLVMPTQATDWYDAYVGFPLPDTGAAYLDFYVPASWPGTGKPTYGLLFDRDAYTGLYIEAYNSSTVWRVSQFGSDTPYVFTPVASTWYRAHMAWDGTTVTINVWKQADPEPPGWQYTQPQQFSYYTPSTDGAPFLDLYQFSATGRQDARLDNLEIWTAEPSWHGFGGFAVQAEISTVTHRSGSFTLNAEIKKTAFTVDAVVISHTQAAFLVAAYISRSFFHIDAQIRPGKTFTVNAVLKKNQPKSFTLNAEVFAGTRLRSFKVDANLRRGGAGTWYVNAELRLPHVERDKTFLASAVIKGSNAGSFDINAWIIDRHKVGSFTLDADTRGQNEKRGTFTVRAVVRLAGSGVFGVAAEIIGNRFFRIDAQIRPYFRIDAQIIGRVTTTRTFAVDAQVYGGHATKSFGVAAEIWKSGTQAGRYFWLDAWIKKSSGTQTFTVNAQVRGGGRFTIDAFVRPSFTVDAFIRSNVTVIWSDPQTGTGGSTPVTGTFTDPTANFTPGMVGSIITINGVPYTIVSVIDPHTITVSPAIPGGQTGLPWTVDPGATDPDGNPLPPGFKSARKWQVRITIDGVDVTGDVNWSRTSFTQNAKTNPGTFELVLYGPQPYNGGEEILVTLDDFRTFGGYVLQIERGYIFDSDADWPVTFLRGADFNVLFDKLITYNRGSADDTTGKYTPYKSFAKGSLDTRIINKVFGSYVDLPAGFDYKLFVDTVGVAAPEKPWAMPTSGSPLRQVMQSLSQVTDAVWWIDPYLRLHYGSRTQVTAPHPITDGAGGISSRQLSMSEDMSQLVTDGFLWGTLAYTVEGEIKVEHQHSSLYGSLGPWQYGEFRSDIHHTAYLERRMDSVIERYGKPIKRAQVVIFEPGYQAGQVADIRLTEHGLEAPLVIRSMLLTFAVGKEPDGTKYYCVPRFELSVGLDPEEPWDIYDYLPFPPYPYDDPGGWNRCDDCEKKCIDDNGGGGCTDAACGITDSLARTVVDGWGTSDYGPAWLSVLGSGASAHVDSDHGVLATTADFGAASEDLPLSIPDVFDLTFEFRHEALTGVSEAWWALLITTVSGYQFHVNVGIGASVTPYIQANGDSFADFSVTTTQGVWYTCRFKRDATTLYARFWPSGTSEPGTWDAITSADTPFAFAGVIRSAEFFLSTTTANSSEVWFRNLDIAGLNRCDAVQFEDFNRTVSGAWDSSTDGHAWDVAGNITVGVNGTAGTIRTNDSAIGNDGGNVYVNSSGPWDGPCTMTARFQFSAVGAFHNTGFFDLNDASGYQEVLQVATSGSGGYTFGIGSFDITHTGWAQVPFAANTWYLVEWVRSGGATTTATVWQEGTTKPTTPTVSRAMSAPDTGFPPYFGFQWSTATSHVQDTITFDYIEFDYEGKPCYAGCTDVTVIDDFARTSASAWSNGWIPDTSAGVVYATDGVVGKVTIPSSSDGPGQEVLSIADQTGQVFDITFLNCAFNSHGRMDLDTNGFTPDVQFSVTSDGLISISGFPETTNISTGISLIANRFNVRFTSSVDRSVSSAWLWLVGDQPSSSPTLSLTSSSPGSLNAINTLFLTFVAFPGGGTTYPWVCEIDQIQYGYCAPADPTAPGGPCDDPEGETFGAVTQGWGCETIKVVAGYVELTGQAAQGTLTVYDADTGDFIDLADFDVNDGKTFVLPGSHARVIACYRNYAPEIGSNPSVPRLAVPSVGRRYE